MNTESSDTERPETAPDSESSQPKPARPEPEGSKPDRPQPEKPSTAQRKRQTPDGGAAPPRPTSTGRALAALAASAWLWWQGGPFEEPGDDPLLGEISRLESANGELAEGLREVRAQLESLPTPDSGENLAELESRLRGNATEMELLQKAIAEQNALTRSLQVATESMQGRLVAAEAAVAGVASRELDAASELDIAEVDYLLRLANQRLKLFSDPAATDEVLELADLHLEAMNNPIYLGVRQEIAAARRALSATEVPDYFEISSELDSIQSSLTGLAFRDQAKTDPAEPAEAEEDGWWAKLKGVFSGLVTIRRSTAQENQRISLEDRDYIRQKLWLQLEIANLSLMRRDQAAFRTALERAGQTLETWFDPAGDEYRKVAASLQALASTEVEVELPDISQPWATLRLLRGSRPAAPPPVQSGAVSGPDEAPMTDEADEAVEPGEAVEAEETVEAETPGQGASVTADDEEPLEEEPDAPQDEAP